MKKYYQLAIVKFLKAIEIETKYKVVDKGNALSTYYEHLALVYRDKANYIEASKCFKTAIDLKKQCFGENAINLDIVKLSFNMAILRTEKGEYKKSHELFRKILTDFKACDLPDDHQDIGRVYNYMGIAYAKENNNELAIRSLEKAKEILLKSFPSNSLHIQQCNENIQQCNAYLK